MVNSNESSKLSFFSRAKQKLLIFYDVGAEMMGTPLETLDVRIEEWINLLKSFSFFETDRLTPYVENFKKCVANINQEIIRISGYINIYSLINTVFNFIIKKECGLNF